MSTKDGTRIPGSRIAPESLTGSQIEDGSITAADLAPGLGGDGAWSPLVPHTVASDGETSIFTLPWSLSATAIRTVAITRNGLTLIRAANPGTIDEWKIAGDQLTFGAPPATTDVVVVTGWTD